MIKLRFALICYAFCIFSPSAAHAAPLEFSITYSHNNKAAATCARLLQASVASLGDDIAVRFISQETDRAHRDKMMGQVYIELIRYDWASRKIAQLPFLFRDAEHFQAYLTSDLYAEFVAIDTLGLYGEIAHAYGGFFQIYSYDAAVTEPKHFYRRQIGGIAQAPAVYRQFGGETVFGLGFFGGDTVAEDAKRMAEGDKFRNMVEGLLINAFESGIDKNARYVNLVSSSVNTVYFQTSDAFAKLTDSAKRRIRTWVRAGAAACSAENFQTEVEVLDRLKKAGLQVVPFNRKAMYEAGVIAALQNSHADWTANDLDRIVTLGKRDPSLPLPSQLLQRAGPEAIKYDREAKDYRSRNLASLNNRSNRQKIDDLQADEIIRFAEAVFKAGPPKKVSQLAELAKQLSPAERDSIRQLTKLLELQIPGCTNCNKSLSWSLAAQGYFLVGDQSMAAAAYSKALGVEGALNEPIVLWTGALIRDPRAVKNALQYCPELCKVEKAQLLNDEDRSRLIVAGLILDEVGEKAASRDALRYAVEFAPKRMAYSLSAAQFAIEPTEANWSKLIHGLRNLPYSARTVSQLPFIPAHWIDVALAKVRLEQHELLADRIHKLRPQTGDTAWEKTLIWERAEILAWEFGVPAKWPKYVSLLTSDIALVSDEFDKRSLAGRAAELQKRLAPLSHGVEGILKRPQGEQARLLLEEMKRAIQAALLKRVAN